MIRVATYARVSTDMQAEEGKSISAQQAEMREFAAARGWTIVAEFVDPGFSGSDLDRPALDSLRAAAQERTFDILLVHELSRLSRRIFDTFLLFEELGKLGIGFASVKEPAFDFSTATGRLFLTLLAALNQYYIDLLKMHTAKSKRERARQGLYNASITPFGYRHSGGPDTPPIIVEEEARAVREMYERYSGGRSSYEEIAGWLNRAGHRTRSGRRFSKDTVADMLRNPFYKGYVVYRQGKRAQDGGEMFIGRHEAIVPPDSWEMARQVREQRRSSPRTYQPKYRVYLLNGIVACDVCGRKLRAQGGKAGSYYREVSGQRGFIDCPASGAGVRIETIDEQVGAIFRHICLPSDWQARMEELIGLEDDEGVTLENQRSRLIAERRRLKEMRIAGEFDQDVDIYNRAQERIQRQLAELEIPGDLDSISCAASALEELAAVWDDADLVDRRDLLRMAIREVKADVKQGRLASLEPYPIFIPLFRQVSFLRETSFGTFVPHWPANLVEELGALPVLSPLTEAPAPGEMLDWPVLVDLPDELLRDRITPVLSEWLKDRRKAGQPFGPLVEMIHTEEDRLVVDSRKWPGVTVDQIEQLQDAPAGHAAFLWTPFLLQRAENKAMVAQQVWEALEPNGTWAFIDVLPASMPGHWLYRFFPAARSNEANYTWDTAQLHRELMKAGFNVKITRRTFYQPVALGAALEMARKRELCLALRILPDEIYEEGFNALQDAVQNEGADHLLESEFCIVQVRALRGSEKSP